MSERDDDLRARVEARLRAIEETRRALLETEARVRAAHARLDGAPPWRVRGVLAFAAALGALIAGQAFAAKLHVRASERARERVLDAHREVLVHVAAAEAFHRTELACFSVTAPERVSVVLHARAGGMRIDLPEQPKAVRDCVASTIGLERLPLEAETTVFEATVLPPRASPEELAASATKW